MTFTLGFTDTAKIDLKKIKSSRHLENQFKAVSKALHLLIINPKHPSLQTHQVYAMEGPHGEKIFEAYAQNNTPKAYRIFFYYGPKQGEIIISAITPHL